jgi:hypothetical protein
MPTETSWEFTFKACGAIAAIVSAVGILAGGAFGLIQYQKQVETAERQGKMELDLLKYDQKKDVYYDLSEAAVYVAHSRTLAEANQRVEKFELIYFGRAHILAMDSEVMTAKANFYKVLLAVLKKGSFPSDQLQAEAFLLTTACQKALKVEQIFSSG